MDREDTFIGWYVISLFTWRDNVYLILEILFKKYIERFLKTKIK